VIFRAKSSQRVARPGDGGYRSNDRIRDGTRLPSNHRRTIPWTVSPRANYARERKVRDLDDATGFSLVPWRPVIDKRLGQSMSAVIRGDFVSWEFGRRRGLSL